MITGIYIEKGTGNRRLNMPTCSFCGKVLSDKRYSVCGKHVDRSKRRGLPSPNKGKHWKLNLSEEQKVHRSRLLRQRVVSEETKQKIREWHTANPFKIKKDTSIELSMQAALADKQILFIKQFPFKGVATVDFYLPEINAVVQCDGCYWHNCLDHYPSHNISQRIKDRTKDAKLQFRGIKVFRFWEHDIRRSVEDCVRIILEEFN